MRRPGIKPGSIAWTATMLTFTPPTLTEELLELLQVRYFRDQSKDIFRIICISLVSSQLEKISWQKQVALLIIFKVETTCTEFIRLEHVI